MSGNSIEIHNLKGIRKMLFKIPGPGVHVLTASNGSGKTTLMTCMSKLNSRDVFKETFIQHKSWNVDSYSDSKIIYRSKQNNNTQYVHYNRSNQWRPINNNSTPLREFGYTNTLIIPTLGNRVYVQNRTISGGQVRAANQELRDAMSTILENNKFSELLKLNLGETRGRGGANRRNNSAFLLPKGVVRRGESRTQTYYSESSFSLGEIFTLNLLFEVQQLRRNSLLVIDELEVALHPRVQINLLRYLSEQATAKNLTIIISTHSSSLIKCAPNLIFLDKGDNGDVNVHYNCYPAFALQEVAVEEDIQPDYVFFVEDGSAEILLKEMLQYFFRNNPDRIQPLYKILPIGGYSEVMRFTNRVNEYLLNRSIAQYAFLDNDVHAVYTELRQIGQNRTVAQSELYNLFETLANRLRYLPVTPELGIWLALSEDPEGFVRNLRDRMPDVNIDIRSLLREVRNHFPHEAENERESAKNKLSYIIEKISTISNEDKKRIRQHITSAYVDQYYSNNENRNSLMQQLGPIFRRR